MCILDEDGEFKRLLFQLPDAQSCQNCGWHSLTSRRLDMVVYEDNKLPKEWNHIVTYFCGRCQMLCARCGKRPDILIVFTTLNACPDCGEYYVEHMRKQRPALRRVRETADPFAGRVRVL